MDKSMNNFNVPKRQKTSVHRKHASVLKMTRAEYAAFKEKYSNEDGKLDPYILSKAAKNLNKIIGGNEVHSISGDEAPNKEITKLLLPVLVVVVVVVVVVGIVNLVFILTQFCS